MWPITVKPHPVFQRKGVDILCDVPINFVTATLGGKIEVPTLKGNTDHQDSRRHATRQRCCASRDSGFPASKAGKPAISSTPSRSKFPPS